MSESFEHVSMVLGEGPGESLGCRSQIRSHGGSGSPWIVFNS